jgi:thiamine pyrophosphokinase
MSSHHIVRENQEPALFIANPDCLADDYLNKLLEWSPTIITLYEHYDLLKSREIKVDVVLDNQGLDTKEIEEDLVLIPYSQDYFVPLFKYLDEKKNHAVNILTDRVNIVDYEPYLEEFVIILLNADRKSLLLKKYEKWLPKGYSLIIENYRGNVEDLKNLNHLDINRYEVASDGFISILEQDNYLLISEEL